MHKIAPICANAVSYRKTLQVKLCIFCKHLILYFLKTPTYTEEQLGESKIFDFVYTKIVTLSFT